MTAHSAYSYRRLVVDNMSGQAYTLLHILKVLPQKTEKVFGVVSKEVMSNADQETGSQICMIMC